MFRDLLVQYRAFYSRPLCKVISRDWRDNKILPRVEAVDHTLIYFFKLIKIGYGSMENVKKMNSIEVLQALHYEDFLTQWESEFLRLNQEQ